MLRTWLTATPCRRILAGTGVFFCVVLPGCYLPIPDLSDAVDSVEVAREEHYRKFVTKMAEALTNGAYQFAYNACSSHLQAKMDYNGFVAFHKQAQREYGMPAKLEVGVGTIGQEYLASEDFDFPSDIPGNLRRAWMHITYALEVDAEGYIERCYDLWLLIIAENGKNRIAHMEYQWCD
ncbi:MAG: hypothetical protein HY706_01755 [Candidatus Hydrogenedentes bacterium]|nr:hypothetical protein [Candidatus Hydrogenedentota bacterium]